MGHVVGRRLLPWLAVAAVALSPLVTPLWLLVAFGMWP